MNLEPVFLVLIACIGGLFLLSVFFAAVAMGFRFRNDAKARRWEALEESWNPIILDVLAGSESPENLLARVAPADGIFFVGYLLRYMRRLRGEERGLVRTLAEPFLPGVQELAHSGNDEERARAIQALGVLGMPDYAEDLMGALDDSSPLVALVAAQTLCRPDHPEFLGEVLGRVHRFQDWEPSYLSGMLAQAGPEGGPALAAILRDRDNPFWIRRVAADALRALFYVPAADLAAEVTVAEEDPELRVSCLHILAALGTQEHRPAVESLLSSPNAEVRAAAVSALSQVGTAEDAGHLEVAAEDPSPWVALEAARGLKELLGEDGLVRLATRGKTQALLAGQVLAE